MDQELPQLFFLRKEIPLIARQIADLEKLRACNSAPSFQAGVSECIKILKWQQAKRTKELKQIEDFMESVDDEIIKQFLVNRYENHCTWRAVAFRAGPGYSEDSIKKMVQRYVKKHT